MLTDATLDKILNALPRIRIGVLGDLFLDRYLDLDANLTEPSIETGLDAYQVVNVRSYPGAAGTVLNNLVALGVGMVRIHAIVGDDGEGYELRRELTARNVDQEFLVTSFSVRTPTYVKPMLQVAGQSARELNRLDVKNRVSTPRQLIANVIARLPEFLASVDGMVVLDQVSEPECGVVTSTLRDAIADLAQAFPAKPILADSRERIGLFRNVSVKPNASECLRATGLSDVVDAVGLMARRLGRPVFCTCGADGMVLGEPGGAKAERILAYPVTGAIDTVGAGDSTSAGIMVAWAAGASLAEAAAFGNLVASITIQQLGTTGTATPEQVLARWREVQATTT